MTRKESVIPIILKPESSNDEIPDRNPATTGEIQ